MKLRALAWWKTPRLSAVSADFCVVIVLLVVITIFYYTLYASWRPPLWRFFIFEFVHSTIGTLYFIPLIYATVRFGVKGCIATWCVSFLAILPQVLHYSLNFAYLVRNVALFSMPLLVSGAAALEIQWRATFRKVMLDRENERQLYIRAVLKAQEDERGRIAQELHDEVIQAMMAIAYVAENTRKRPPVDSASVFGNDGLEWMRDEALRLSNEMRRLCYDLRPSILDSLGLVAAVKWLAERFQSEAGIDVAVRTEGFARRLDTQTETTCFRVVQEALNNVRQHSGAEAATVALTFESGRIMVEVSDNGKGFSTRRRRESLRNAAHLGLFGMKQRVLSLDGKLDVASTRGEGTVVKATIPLVDYMAQVGARH